MKRAKRLIVLEIALLLCSGLVFIFHFFMNNSTMLVGDLAQTANRNNLWIVFEGTVFWLGLIIAIVLSFYIKAMIKKEMLDELTANRVPGIIRFFRNAESIAMTGVFFTCVVLIVIDMYFHFWHPSITIFPFSIGLTAFYMHCVMDGYSYNILFKK